MRTGELSGKLDEMLGGGGNLAMKWHPIQGVVIKLLVAGWATGLTLPACTKALLS